MLVLAILGLIGAMVVPRMNEVFERQRLQGAADLIKIEWEEARLEAMRTGQSQVFTCDLGARTYKIEPLISQADTTDASDGAAVMTTGGVVETESTNLGTVVKAADMSQTSEELEERLSFVTCQVAGDMRSYAVMEESQNTGTGQVNIQNQAQSVIFYPDGTTSTAEVRIQNERGEIRAVQMRGLTGASRIIQVKNVASDVKAKS
jgi:Tfp pilus assembly protein FimT